MAACRSLMSVIDDDDDDDDDDATGAQVPTQGQHSRLGTRFEWGTLKLGETQMTIHHSEEEKRNALKLSKYFARKKNSDPIKIRSRRISNLDSSLHSEWSLALSKVGVVEQLKRTSEHNF